jgi:hypothetical protein
MSHDGFSREVARMLRRARDVQQLQQLPLAGRLCDYFGTSNPDLALRYVVDEALSGDGRAATMRELIVRCYLTGELSQEGTAKELLLSVRHFRQLRDEAVRTIARYVAGMLGTSAEHIAFSGALDRLARLLSAHDPSSARTVYDLVGSERSGRQQRDWLRARIDSGEVLSEHALSECPRLSPTAILALIARSKLQSGKREATPELLARVHAYQGPLDDLTRFEAGYCEFVMAREAAVAKQMKSASAALARLSAEHPQYAFDARVCAVESQLHDGDYERALHSLNAIERECASVADPHALARVTGLRAQYEFSQEHYAAAAELSHAARIALAHRPFEAAQCAVTFVRSQFLQDIDPHRGIGKELGAGSWSRHTVDAIQARSMLRAGDTSACLRLGTKLAAAARANRYDGVAAHVLATLGAAYDASDDAERAQSAYVASLAMCAALGSRLVAFDLFLALDVPVREIGPLNVGRSLVEAVYLALVSIVPQQKDDTREQRDLVRSWIRSLLDMLSDPSSSWRAFEQSIEEMSLQSCALVYYAASAKGDLIRMLESFVLPVFTVPARQLTRQRIVAMVENLCELAHPATSRRFVIG